MVLSTEITKKVDIPASLPPLEHMTRLEGNIVLKNVVAENEGLRVTGDLLWRGIFQAETEAEECLWEGAEFFSHLVDLGVLRNSDTFLLDPRVVDLSGEAAGEGGYRLTFSILWADANDSLLPPAYESPSLEEMPDFRELEFEAAPSIPGLEQEDLSLEDRYEEIAEQWSDTLDILEAGATSPSAEEEEAFAAEGNDMGKEMVVERECNSSDREGEEAAFPAPLADGRETEDRKIAASQEKAAPREQPARSELGAIHYSDALTIMEPLLSEPFKLRYYRVQWGEDLSAIADRLSASIAKIKELNTLEEEDIKVGTVLRIP